MNKTIILLIVIAFHTIISFGQKKTTEIIGSYYSINNNFERWSIITLKDNQNFEYDYGVGGCQGKITGKWFLEENFLKLINKPEYKTNNRLTDSTTLQMNDSITISFPQPFYPNLELSKWKIGKFWIKPLQPINTGCFKEKGKHKKRE